MSKPCFKRKISCSVLRFKIFYPKNSISFKTNEPITNSGAVMYRKSAILPIVFISDTFFLIVSSVIIQFVRHSSVFFSSFVSDFSAFSSNLL